MTRLGSGVPSKLVTWKSLENVGKIAWLRGTVLIQIDLSDFCNHFCRLALMEIVSLSNV